MPRGHVLFSDRKQRQHSAQNALCHRRRKRAELVPGYRNAAVFALGAFDYARGELIQVLVLLAQYSGRAVYAVGGGGIYFAKDWHDPVPYFVSSYLKVAVCLVLDVRHSPGFEIRFYLAARRIEQGAYEYPAYGRYSRKPLHAGAAYEIHKHRLGVVLGIVGRRYTDRAKLYGGFFEIGVAQVPRRLLYRPAVLLRGCAHVAVPAAEFYIVLFTPFADEGLVAVRVFAAEVMVEVRGGDGETALLGQLAKPRQHTHRISSAGHGAQHQAALGQHAIAFKKF
ncbi:hypothetical protein SDC9_145774 [bioreactor metagenome]|uniref:Uncharacterized protein n=1 Tax=bioreactor metagenome TaxID=1076179 RepID=A0A645EAC9_9ZZZZ